MLQEERFIRIIEYLKEKGSARFSEIAEVAGVSENTVRKDLAELDKRKIISLVRGGAVWKKSDLTRGDSQVRDIINREKKQELVKSLSGIVKDGQAVFMNGGTTNIEAAEFLAHTYSRLTIISNNLTALDMCRSRKEFQLILAGGVYYGPENTVTGRQVEQDVAMYNADIAILSVNSISLKKGITDFRMEESGIINAMIENAEKTVAVADSSKFERVAHINVCPIDSISCFLTDSSMDSEVLAKYRKHGVEIIMPE